jgi:hypothetical protein
MRSRNLAAFLAGVAFVAVWYVYHLGGQNATLTLRLKASDSTLVALAQRQRAVDTVYQTDTLRLKQYVTKWRGIAQAVDDVYTKSQKADTSPVPRDTVRLLIATADTAIRACLVTVQTCEQRIAIRDSVIATLRAQRPLLQGKGLSLKEKALWGLFGAGIGYIAADRRR